MVRNGSNENYRRVESLYQEALDLPVEQRPAFLSKACNGNRDLQQEVEILLKHYEAAGEEYLTRPVFARADAGPTVILPERIGNYKIIHVLGEGGMGKVYEAQQAQPKRRVAIKVLRYDLASDHMLKRFQQEIEVLGQLRHPGIAQIHETGIGDVWFGGVCTHAQPFFAMELVRGQPLTEYADNKNAPVRTRLELFLRVCDAVQHAHQNGVIHRDLKPANILVDSTDQPKILDFGIARATRANQQQASWHTQVGQIMGTLAYMSPEQIAGDGHQLDTRSDIYALGVVLYELLTGELPLDCRDCPLAEAVRIIQDEEPRTLSEANYTLRGDLDTIVAKALEKDPSRRYQSAGELAVDIHHHLHGEMINAKRDSALYVFRKTIARYRWPLFALSAFIVLLSTFAIYAMSQAQRHSELASRERQASQAAVMAEHRADEQRQQAEAQAERADAVKVFLQMMLVAADPAQARARDLTVREVLDEAARQIQSGTLADQPDAEIEIRETIARTYNHLGLYNSATPHYEWLHDSYGRRYGEANYKTLQLLNELATNYSQAEDYESAKTAFERCLELVVSAHGDDQELTLVAMDGLGSVLAHMGRAEEAESLHLEAIESVEEVFGTEHELYVSTTFNLGGVYLAQGRLDDAEHLYLQAMAHSERFHGDESYFTIRIRRCLALDIYFRTERLDEAEQLLRETLEISRRALGVEHTETNTVLIGLSRVLTVQDRTEKAEQLLRDAIASFREIRGIEGNDTLKVVSELAHLLAAREEYEEAACVLGDGIKRATQVDGEEHPKLADWIYMYAGIIANTGDFEAAAEAAKQALGIRELVLGAENVAIVHSLQQVGWYSQCAGDYQGATHWYRRALALRRKVSGETHQETIRSTITLAYAMILAGEDIRAAVDISRERYTLVRAEKGDTHKHTQWTASYFACVLSFATEHTEAIELDRTMLALLTAQHSEDALETAPWWRWLGFQLFNSGQVEDAVESYQRALSIFNAHEQQNAKSALEAKMELAEALIAIEELEDAEVLARDALEGWLEIGSDRTLHVPRSMIILGNVMTTSSRFEKAELLLRETLAIIDERRLKAADVSSVGGQARSVLGQCLAGLGHYDEAESLMLEGYRMLQTVEPMRRIHTNNARLRLVALYEDWGKPEKANEWRDKG